MVASTAVFAAAEAPTYVTRLELPVAGDAIGYPDAVAVDPGSGEVLVCDSRKSRILIFDPAGFFSYQIPGGIVFSAPRDLAVAPDGLLLVLANHERHRALLELDFDGLFLREIRLSGGPEPAVGPDLASVALSPSGERLYVLDAANLTVSIADRDGRVRTSVDLAAGLSDKDKADLILGKLDVYGDSVLIAVPSMGSIRIFDRDGVLQQTVGIHGTAPCQTAFPRAAALDVNGHLVVVDQQRMILSRWDPADNRCLGEYYGPGTGLGYLYYPLDVALDGAGRLYTSQGHLGLVQAYEGLAPAARSTVSPDQLGAWVSPDPRPEDDVDAATAGATETVRAWIRARSERRVEGYLSTYSADFLPPDVGDRETWEASRRDDFERAEWIELDTSDMKVELVLEDFARATFFEVDRSNLDSGRVKRTLLMRRENGDWRIIEERSDPIP